MKASLNEKEYFIRQEIERRKKVEQEKQAQLNALQKQQLKDLHFMHCPKCGQQLIEIDYKGIAVDKCSQCDGVWLDAGELEQVAQLEKNILDKWFTIFRK